MRLPCHAPSIAVDNSIPGLYERPVALSLTLLLSFKFRIALCLSPCITLRMPSTSVPPSNTVVVVGRAHPTDAIVGLPTPRMLSCWKRHV
jgi:hypothetical protein